MLQRVSSKTLQMFQKCQMLQNCNSGDCSFYPYYNQIFLCNLYYHWLDSCLPRLITDSSRNNNIFYVWPSKARPYFLMFNSKYWKHFLFTSVHRISQARILEWVATSFFGASFWPRNSTPVSSTSLYCRQILYHWATRKPGEGKNM